MVGEQVLKERYLRDVRTVLTVKIPLDKQTTIKPITITQMLKTLMMIIK